MVGRALPDAGEGRGAVQFAGGPDGAAVPESPVPGESGDGDAAMDSQLIE